MTVSIDYASLSILYFSHRQSGILTQMENIYDECGGAEDDKKFVTIEAKNVAKYTKELDDVSFGHSKF